MRRLVPSLLILALAACAGSTAGPPQSAGACPESDALLSPGEMLPDCTLEGMFGSPPLALADLRGSPVVLNFWASWCVYCIEEMPGYQRVYESLGDQVEFVGINFLGGTNRETRPAAETFATRTGVRYRLVYDPEGGFYSYFSRSVLRPLMPLTVFVAPDGTVAERHFGPLDEDELRDAIREHLSIG